jgi:hypothetical protein
MSPIVELLAAVADGVRLLSIELVAPVVLVELLVAPMVLDDVL